MPILFAYSIQDWLEECFKLIDKDWRNHVSFTKGFTSEYQRLVSNPQKIKSLGWNPIISLSELAQIMFESKTMPDAFNISQITK